MAGNNSFLWSRTATENNIKAQDREGTSRVPAPASKSKGSFLFSGKHRDNEETIYDDAHIYGKVGEEQYEDVGIYEEELYNDCDGAGFADEVNSSYDYVSSARSSDTSGICSPSDQSLQISDLGYDVADPIRPFSDVLQSFNRNISEKERIVPSVKKAASTGGTIPYKKSGFAFSNTLPKKAIDIDDPERQENSNFRNKSFMKHPVSVQKLTQRFEKLSSNSPIKNSDDSVDGSIKLGTLKTKDGNRGDKEALKVSGSELINNNKNQTANIKTTENSKKIKHSLGSELNENVVKTNLNKGNINNSSIINDTKRVPADETIKSMSIVSISSDKESENDTSAKLLHLNQHPDRIPVNSDYSHNATQELPTKLERNKSFLAELQASLERNVMSPSNPQQSLHNVRRDSNSSNTLYPGDVIAPPRPPKSPRISGLYKQKQNDKTNDERPTLSSQVTSNSATTSADVSPIVPERSPREPPPRPPPPRLSQTQLTLAVNKLTPPPLPRPASLISVSSSSSSLSDSSPPSPTSDEPPPPPPISTLPKRSHSTLSAKSRPLSTWSDISENLYEVLEDYVNEPLYQFYNQNAEELAREYISREFEAETSSVQPTAFTAVPPQQRLVQGHHRTLWSQLPEVCEAGILDSIDPTARQLQEAKFEILTSEVSYMNSLNILKNHFIARLQTCDDSEITKEIRSLLFLDILPVRKVSEKFISNLENCKKKDVYLRGICDIVRDAAKVDFKVYIRYCSYQKQRERTLERLASQPQSLFAQLLAKLEADPVCQGLPMHSFLLVPMQRITKLQLLMDSILSRMDPDDPEYTSCKQASQELKQIVHQCNEEVRRVERMEELMHLSTQIEFSRNMRSTALFSSSRWLVKKGKVTEINYTNELFPTRSIYIFLFNDLLVLAKKSRWFGPERFKVEDYCDRKEIMLMNTEGALHLPNKFSSGSCLLLTLVNNHKHKKISKLLFFSCESERARWTEALSPPKDIVHPKTEDNKTSDEVEWREKPQVVVKWSYTASQPDELTLSVGDIVSVINKSSDGWYQGVRIRDGETGWFPGNYTVEVDAERLRSIRNQRNDMTSIYYV